MSDFDVRGNAKVIGIITANNLEISGVSTFTQVSIGSTITFDSTSGVITASSYKGDGSTLSNLPTSQWTDVNTVELVLHQYMLMVMWVWELQILKMVSK